MEKDWSSPAKNKDKTGGRTVPKVKSVWRAEIKLATFIASLALFRICIGGDLENHSAIRMKLFFKSASLVVVAMLLGQFCVRAETVDIIIGTNASPRVKFGAEKIAEALKVAGQKVVWGVGQNPQVAR